MKNAAEREPREGVSASDLVTTRDEALAAFKSAAGAEQVLQRIPNYDAIAEWQDVVFFGVSSKHGTARYLDVWDADHFAASPTSNARSATVASG